MKKWSKILISMILCIALTPLNAYAAANNGFTNSDFYAVEPYQMITSRSSRQYAINYSERAYTDENGLRRLSAEKGRQRSDDPYMVAIGTSFNAPVGTSFTATINGITRNYVVGDIKADQHTDPTNTFTTHGGGRHCVIEYLVDKEHPNYTNLRSAGSIGDYLKAFSGDITHMNFPSVDEFCFLFRNG